MTRVLAIDLAATSANWALPPEGEARIRAAAPEGWDVRVVRAPTTSDGDGGAGPSAEALEAVHDAEAYLGFGLTRPLFVAAPRLRWVHSAAAGVGSALFAEMVESDVAFTNSAGVHAIPIAEHVVGGLIYVLRRFDVAVDRQRAGVWDKQPFLAGTPRVRELGDCRALVVGTGGLGSAIGALLYAFGTRCVGIRRRPSLGPPAGFERVVAPDRLDDELTSADVLVLAAPATDATRDLITAARLDRLPRAAVVVNVARGALLDEQALAIRVGRGRLGGAVLDVFREEPLPASSPLWRLSQVLITPHVAAVSPARFWDRELALFADNWQRFARGEPLRNVVDKHAGY